MAAVGHQGFQTPEQPSLNDHQTPLSQVPAAVPVWQNPNPPLPRGRAPRDPLAVTTRFQCTTLADMENRLREYLDNRPAAPEHCTCELTLWAGASFLVKLDYVPPNLRTPQQQLDMGMLQPVADEIVPQRPQSNSDSRESTLSVLDALQQLNDPKETMKRQRAISKVCVAAVQKTDGYRYSFHNSWKSGEDNAYRFSYYCNDSLLNKDRVANGKSGSQGKRATKPVYDCKGVLSIKFSATKQCIDVVYRHVPCHETYEDRAPPPRKTSKRRAEWETKFPDRIKIGKTGSEASGADELPAPERQPKKKRKSKEKETAMSAESELREQSMFSLLELMRPAEGPKKLEEARAVPDPTPAPIAQATPSTPVATQKAPARRKQNSAVCAICSSRRMKCDGAKPKCKSCTERNWPCFYQPEVPNNQPTQAGAMNPGPHNHIPATPATPASLPSFDTMHQNELAALTLSNQNEDLQKELANVRQDQLSTHKETLDLKEKMTAMMKQIETLQAENSRLNAPQIPQNTVNVNQDRRTSQHHQLPSTPAQPSYASQQYQNNAQHMYHQPAPPQATHTRAPVYQQQQANDRAPAAWNQPLYNAYTQSNQHQSGMLPGTHMPGNWRQ